jgi:hypothetical protein
VNLPEAGLLLATPVFFITIYRFAHIWDTRFIYRVALTIAKNYHFYRPPPIE